MSLRLRPARLDLREDLAEGRRGVASEFGALRQLSARRGRAREAAEVARERARRGERGEFLEDERADFFRVLVGKITRGGRGQIDLRGGLARAAEVAVAAIFLRERLAEIAEQPPRDAPGCTRKIEDLREPLRIAIFTSREKIGASAAWR